MNSLANITTKLPINSADTIMTDCNGRFTTDSLDTGFYVVEATDGENDFALIDSVLVKDYDSTLLPPDTLKPAGAIKGVIRLSEGGDPRKVFVLAFGLDRFATTDSTGGFTFKRLAEGGYTLRVLPTLDDYGILDIMNISVASGDTFDIGVIEPMFTGIPTVKNIAINYDTLTQWVTISWTRPATGKTDYFNIYRRTIDPAAAVFTQLNAFPVIDTLFIDSLGMQNRTYEYRITAVDSASAAEGAKSPAVTAKIALYNIAPKNAIMMYDTIRQTVTLRWSNSDTARVTSYNVYRRNIDRNEVFWTPFSNAPLVDTFFIDSTFKLSLDGDSIGLKEPSYEYCIAALIRNVREGVRSDGMPLKVCLKYLTPKNLDFTYDTLKQKVHLLWNRPDMTIVQGFAVFRRAIDGNDTVVSQINNKTAIDTFYTDSTGEQNRSYEYCVATVVKNGRALVKSEKVEVLIAGSFIEEMVFTDIGDGEGQLRYPNDIAIASNGKIYIVDQGNSRIQVFDSTMRYKTHLGDGILDYPLKVSVDERGQVFAANYDIDRDVSSIFIFDATGKVTDTILDSMVINDLDVKGGRLYTLTEGRYISIHSYDGNRLRSWQAGGQEGGKWIAAADSNKIFVSTGRVFPDRNKVNVFDSLGNRVRSLLFPFYPYALAYDDTKQLLYAVCYTGTNGSILHVLDANNVERGSYKIQSDDQNVSIGIRNNGAVYLAIKSEGKILKLKPTADF
jgi:archaellum component FlaF (FlaF/FlaG flagellin family)